MKEKPKIQMSGISQIKISKKWVLITTGCILFFLLFVGGMFIIAATSRPPTVNSGGFEQGAKW